MSTDNSDVFAAIAYAQAKTALAEVRRIKSILKKPTKAKIAKAVLPVEYEGLLPATRDFQAATHIRELAFADMSEAHLEFAEEPASAPETRA